LSAQVYETIKNSILSLELQPGETLSIGDLAEQFQISRTPVRDALLLLEMYELHIALESYAVRVTVPYMTDQDLKRLEQIILASRHALEVHQQYLLASDLGREFHDVFVQKLANRRLTAYLQDLNILYTRLRHFSALMAGRLERSYQQHLVILHAVQEHDAGRAAQAMAEHFMSVSNEILNDRNIKGLEDLLSEPIASTLSNE
jgi:DNA-binding GntR family transcriptional regulator